MHEEGKKDELKSCKGENDNDVQELDWNIWTNGGKGADEARLSVGSIVRTAVLRQRGGAWAAPNRKAHGWHDVEE